MYASLICQNGRATMRALLLQIVVERCQNTPVLAGSQRDSRASTRASVRRDAGRRLESGPGAGLPQIGDGARYRREPALADLAPFADLAAFAALADLAPFAACALIAVLAVSEVAALAATCARADSTALR